MIPLRPWLQAAWQALRYRGDVLAGPHRIGTDLDGRDLVLDEISIRNVLLRIDPLCATAHGDRVRVPADEVVAAIRDRHRPIHRAIPNQIAAAPRRDRAALARLRRLAEVRVMAQDDAHLEWPVPEPVASWIRLRHARAERLIETIAYG